MSMSSDHIMPIKFTETIQDVHMIHFALNTQHRYELSMCTCKVKGYLSANFAKSKYVMLMLNFCQYQTNPLIQNYFLKKLNGLESNSSNA